MSVVAPALILPPFWSLVEVHGEALLRHARRLAGDEAEDVVQEALLRALRAYPRLQHAEHLRAWLYRIVTTTAMDAHRGRAHEVAVAEPPAVTVEPEHYDDTFEALLAPLPSAARTALRLRFVEDLDYAGVGDALGCSAVAARQRVSVAVRALRAEVPA